MKFKRIISAVSAFAMALSLVTVANAASLGGKPSVTATFDGYDKVSDTVAFAYVKVTLDMSAAEALKAYELVSDDTTNWEEVEMGNGISTLGIAYDTMSGFTYNKSKSTIPTDFTVNATSIAYGPVTSPEKYWVEPVTTIRIAYKAANFDSKGTFVLDTNNISVDGKDVTSGEVWGYRALAGEMTATGCSIPSYNEWANPTPEVPATEVNVTGDAATGYDVSGKDADAAIAGQKVLFDTAKATLAVGDVLKNTSRFIVKYVVDGVVQKEKNYNIYEAAKAEGDGEFTVAKTIAVGIAYDKNLWDADKFEFSIVK